MCLRTAKDKSTNFSESCQQLTPKHQILMNEREERKEKKEGKGRDPDIYHLWLVRVGGNAL
jgi:predicted transcriptional regulator